MKVSEYTYLLNKPESISNNQTVALESIVQQYPYFQSARSLFLKGLYNSSSYRYNHELKKTAAYTTDRNILFDFITSTNFKTINTELIEKIQKELNEIIVVQPELIRHEPSIIHPETLSSFKEKEIKIEESLTEIEKKLDIKKPLEFDFNEKHSFGEWLKLAKFSPIARNESIVEPKIEEEKQKKSELIDKFIESNPKISPVKENVKTPDFIEKKKDEPTHLMTETLARIYLEQKKYNKAIQAYEILILKYPEKSIFFADRIKDIKNLQQNN